MNSVTLRVPAPQVSPPRQGFIQGDACVPGTREDGGEEAGHFPPRKSQAFAPGWRDGMAMMAPQEGRVRWTIEDAERLLLSLPGVVSARVVARPGGEVEEIHLLTTMEVKPKQTVRNVESALLASLDLHVDHRKISVAQTQDKKLVAPPEPERPIFVVPEPKPH